SDETEPLALTAEEKAALIALLKRTLDYARYPYSPRHDPLKAILAKLVPPAPIPEPKPPLRPGMGPSVGRGRRSRGLRRDPSARAAARPDLAERAVRRPRLAVRRQI